MQMEEHTPTPTPTPAPKSQEDKDGFDMDQLLAEAVAGSEKAQLQLGVHFLKLAESEVDKEENAEKAVKWLVAASKQGNDEATQKIQHCVKTNLGITEMNTQDVTWCLNTTSAEKRIRHAAKSMFRQLNPSESTMSKEQYIEAINKLTVGHEKERKLLLAAGKKIGSTITENDFVKTLSKKINGTLMISSSEMDAQSADYQSATLAQKLMNHPKQTATIIMNRSLEYASSEGMNLIVSLIPTNQLYLLLLMFFYSFLTPGILMFIIPFVIFIISFLTLIIATLQMFYKRRKQRDSSDLASLLQQKFDTSIDLDSTASQFSWNSLTPYLVFFCFLPIMVGSFSLVSKSYVPCSEIYIIAMVMTGFSFFGLSDSHDSLTMLTLVAHLFATLPIFLVKLPKIYILTAILDLFTKPLLKFDMGLGFSVNLGIPSLIYMLIPLLFLRIAIRNSWSGIHKVLIPHLVCYNWFCIATSVFPHTSWKGLFRATLGYLLMPVLIPVLALASVAGLFYLGYKLLQTQMIGKVLLSVVLLGIPIAISQAKYLFGKKKGEKGEEKKADPRMEKIRMGVMIGFSVVALIPLFFVQVPITPQKQSLQIGWEDFKEMCIPPSGKATAPYQIRCHDFQGFKGSWKGVVKQVSITKTENTAESIINSLPGFLSTTLYCIYGEPMPECNELTMSQPEFKHCQLMTSTGHSCHLKSQSQISMSISVLVDGVTVSLDAGPGFKSLALALQPGDELDFVGIITNAGTSAPQLKLKTMKCTNRELPVMHSIDKNDELYIRKTLTEALEMTVNFALFPIVAFSPDELLMDD